MFYEHVPRSHPSLSHHLTYASGGACRRACFCPFVCFCARPFHPFRVLPSLVRVVASRGACLRPLCLLIAADRPAFRVPRARYRSMDHLSESLLAPDGTRTRQYEDINSSLAARPPGLTTLPTAQAVGPPCRPHLSGAPVGTLVPNGPFACRGAAGAIGI